MNEEKYILAELKRWLVNQNEYKSPREVICQIAKIEADAVLGEEIVPEEPEMYEEVEA